MTATTRATRGMVTMATANSWMFSQNPDATSGHDRAKSSPLKNWSRTFGQLGLATTRAPATPKNTTVDTVAMAAPRAPSWSSRRSREPGATSRGPA